MIFLVYTHVIAGGTATVVVTSCIGPSLFVHLETLAPMPHVKEYVLTHLWSKLKNIWFLPGRTLSPHRGSRPRPLHACARRLRHPYLPVMHQPGSQIRRGVGA